MTNQPRFLRPRLRRWILLSLAFVAALVRLWWVSQNQEPAPLAEGRHAVQRIIDGDTLVLNSGRRIRLQGIDTPELAHHQQPAEPYAHQARKYAQAFVDEAGGILRVEFTDERLDRYGRTLAFLWSGQRCLNEELVREGLAKARLDYRFSGAMRSQLRDAQRQAQSTGSGIWSAP